MVIIVKLAEGIVKRKQLVETTNRESAIGGI